MLPLLLLLLPPICMILARVTIIERKWGVHIQHIHKGNRIQSSAALGSAQILFRQVCKVSLKLRRDSVQRNCKPNSRLTGRPNTPQMRLYILTNTNTQRLLYRLTFAQGKHLSRLATEFNGLHLQGQDDGVIYC